MNQSNKEVVKSKCVCGAEGVRKLHVLPGLSTFSCKTCGIKTVVKEPMSLADPQCVSVDVDEYISAQLLSYIGYNEQKQYKLWDKRLKVLIKIEPDGTETWVDETTHILENTLGTCPRCSTITSLKTFTDERKRTNY